MQPPRQQTTVVAGKLAGNEDRVAHIEFASCSMVRVLLMVLYNDISSILNHALGELLKNRPLHHQRVGRLP
jgi:hypothetical protein